MLTLMNKLFGTLRGTRAPSPYLGKPQENAELARWEYEQGETILRSLPPVVNFVTTTYCNFSEACLPCDRQTRSPLADSETDNHVIRAAEPLLKTALVALLHCGGEAMCSKFFDKLISMIEPPTRVRFATNATLMTRRRTDLMLERDIMGMIFISLDAATPQIYRIMRPSSDFLTVLHNVAYYTDRAQVLQRVHAGVSLNMTVCHTNLDDIPKLIDLAVELGANHVEYRHLNEGFSHTVKTVAGWEWVYTEQAQFEDPDRHDQLILEAYHRGKSHGIEVVFVGKPFIGPQADKVPQSILEDLGPFDLWAEPGERPWFSPKHKAPEAGKTACPNAWRLITVQPRGDVRLCCFHDINQWQVGHILKSDIMAVRNSRAMIRQRKQALSNSFSKACSSSLPCSRRGRA